MIGCKKDIPDAVVGETEISFSWQSPTSNSIIHISEEVHVDGIISANAMMGGWRASIVRSSTGEIMSVYEDLYEQTQYMFHHHWYTSPSDTGEMYIIVEALDKNINVLDSDTIRITIEN